MRIHWPRSATELKATMAEQRSKGMSQDHIILATPFYIIKDWTTGYTVALSDRDPGLLKGTVPCNLMDQIFVSFNSITSKTA